LGMPLAKFSVGVDTLNVGAELPGGGEPPLGGGVPDEPPDPPPPPPQAPSNKNTLRPHSVRPFEKEGIGNESFPGFLASFRVVLRAGEGSG
jgi:hypothetical protein